MAHVVPIQYYLNYKTVHWANRAYESDGLGNDLKQEGIDMIAPRRSTYKFKTPGGRHLCWYDALARRTVLCVVCNGSGHPHSLGILQHDLPGFCPACRHDHIPQTILRWILV